MNRLCHLPVVALSAAPDVEVRVANTRRSRLLGLAWLRASEGGLLLERTRSVHTFGMRFALDLIWLGEHGQIVRTDTGVPPRRIRTCLSARSVLELPHTR